MKQDIAAPGDYHEMIFQLKAFLTILDILFGNESIVVEKIKDFIKLIEKNSIYYKGYQCQDEFFPIKIIWTVCRRFQLFLAACQ